MADPFTLLHATLSSQDAVLKQQFAQAILEQPGALPTICATLLPSFKSFDSPTRAWVLRDIVEIALAKAPLAVEQKTTIALQTLDHLMPMLQESNFVFRKIAVQVLASAYPIVFRHSCLNPGDAPAWNKITAAKNFALNSWSGSSNLGVRVAATKFVQRVIQTQSRSSADPRLSARSPDINLGMCPSSHPVMNAGALDEEAKRLLEDCIKLLYISNFPDLVCAVVNSFATLVKCRPTLSNSIFISLVNWEASSLAGASPLQIRSVEKTFRITLAHLLKSGHAGSSAPQITEFLQKQNTRMMQAADELRRSKAEAQRKRSVTEVESTNQMVAPGTSGDQAKRRRVEGAEAFTSASAASQSENPLAGFDVTTLPVHLVAELIIANLQVTTESRLTEAIQEIRKILPTSAGGVASTAVEQAEEQELADENEELKLARVDEAGAAADGDEDMGALEDFELPEPPMISDASHLKSLFQLTVERISTGPKQHAEGIWAPMLIRLATRGLVGDDQKHSIRETLFGLVQQTPSERLDLARSWLCEEWLALEPEKSSEPDSPYAEWLDKVLDLLESPEATSAPTFKTTFSSFILDMPLIMPSTFDRLLRMCQSKEQLQVGFTTLREMATLRPLARQIALDQLLSLTTHYTKQTRNAAIVTVKRWVPDQLELGGKVRAFAVELVHRARDAKPPKKEEEREADMQVDGEDQKPVVETYAKVKDSQIIEGLPPITSEAQLQQHLELLLALSAKLPDLLDELVIAYPAMDKTVQDLTQTVITPLVRGMGPQNPKIHSIIQNSTKGAESLVIRIVNILTDRGSVPPAITSTIKQMASEKDLNPRLLAPVLRDFSKSEIINTLPKIAALLAKPEEKPLVRSLFESIITPPHTFGSISTNVQRMQQNELLTPVELLATLHHQEKALGIKLTREAISLCLNGMIEVFKPEVLAAFMQQVVDEPVLPMLYMSTVISAVTLHRSLQPYVSTTLLMRLITKKIWSMPQLWEGFVRCAKATQPHSFDALLQLPKDPFLQVMQKQPTLLGPLREFATQRYAGKPKLTTLLEWLGAAEQAQRAKATS